MFKIFIFLNAVLLISCNETTEHHMKEEIIKRIFSSYDVTESPNSNETGPLHINLTGYVLSVSSIDICNQEYTVDLYFRQSWIDDRLRHPSVGIKKTPITLRNDKAIWTPDTFFTNSRNTYDHDFMHVNSFIKIYPEGRVLYSKRLTLQLSCPMNLAKYPFDVQTCEMTVESYGQTAESIVYQWKSPNPVQVSDVLPHSYSLKDLTTDNGIVKLTTGEYAFAKLTLTFERSSCWAYMQIFVPSAMIVIVSWIPFWIKRSEFIVRTLIGISSLFVMTMQSFYVTESLPSTPYVKAVDIFTGISITFIFAAFIETIYVHICYSQSGGKTTYSNASDIEAEKNGKVIITQNANGIKNWMKSNLHGENKIDFGSRLVFPILYLTFIVLYWIMYSK